MALIQGTIERWLPDKGYGFLSAEGIEGDVFLHASQFRDAHYTPTVGDRIAFVLVVDKQGRAKARSARQADAITPSPGRRRAQASAVYLGIGILPFAAATLLLPITALPLIMYAVMSAVSFCAYWHDKAKAQAGYSDRRTPEMRLHVLDLLGGWPGGLAAQRIKRHKSSKLSFQVVFWFIVTIHIAAAALLLLFPDAPLSRSLLHDARTLVPGLGGADSRPFLM